MAPLLGLVELRIPLRRPLSNARGAVTERRIVLIAVTEAGVTGWGEAAPYPGVTAEDADDVWKALRARPESAPGGDPSALPAAAAAGLDQARADLAARREGTPLWSLVGGDARPVRACEAVGLEGSRAGTVNRVERAVEAGIREVKVKIEPGRDLEYLRAVRDRFPRLMVAADANGSYEADDRFFEEVDGLGLAYLEQPLAAHDLDGHAELRDRLSTPVCLDESAGTPAGALDVIERGAADIVSVKPGLLGVTGSRQVMERARAAGVTVKIGGLVETSVGRAHALALATRREVKFTDLVPPRRLLAGDVSPHPWELTNGYFHPPDSPGTGIRVDPFGAGAAGYVTRHELFES